MGRSKKNRQSEEQGKSQNKPYYLPGLDRDTEESPKKKDKCQEYETQECRGIFPQRSQ
jgi:hypothetical protein